MSSHYALRGICLTGVAFAALMSSAASAADEPPQGSATTSEIVVTAQFKSQKVQDTPLAISAVNSEMLEARSQSTVADIATRTPSLGIQPSASGGGPASSNITIRGIGQTDTIGGVEPGVGVYVDDVYYGILNGAIFELSDVDRVEVLRGPQGTLAGKNSEGGSIKLFSRAPSEAAEGNIEASFGSFDKIQLKGAFNVPLISDRVMLRVSGVYRHQDGFVTSLDYGCLNPGSGIPQAGSGAINNGCELAKNGGQDLAAIRAALRIVFSDDIENTVTVDRVSDHRQADPSVLIFGGPFQGDAFNTGGTYTNYNTFIGYLGTTHQYQGFRGNDSDQWGVSNKFTADVGDINFTSITAYRSTRAHGNQSGSLSPVDIFMQDTQVKFWQFSQEARLSGRFGSFAEWTVGGYHFEGHNLAFGHINIAAVGLDFLNRDPIVSKTDSAFGNLILHPTEALNITGGVRYTHETKTYTFRRTATDGTMNSPPWAPLNFTVYPLDGVSSAYRGNKVDWRLAMDYRFSPEVMIYAQAATGFKGGGINPRPFFPSQAVPFRPETVRTYEAGVKSDLLDRSVRLNVTGFYTKFNDMQLVVSGCDAISPFPGAPCTQTTNAGKSKLWGAEIEAELHPVEGLEIDGSASFTGFKFESVNAATGIPLDRSLPFLSKTKFAIGAQYEFPLFGGTLTPRVDVDYLSGFITQPTPIPNSDVPSRTLANARVSFKPASDDWELSVTVTNLFDKYYYANVFNPGPPFLSEQGIVGRPREWSVSVKRKF